MTTKLKLVQAGEPYRPYPSPLKLGLIVFALWVAAGVAWGLVAATDPGIWRDDPEGLACSRKAPAIDFDQCRYGAPYPVSREILGNGKRLVIVRPGPEKWRTLHGDAFFSSREFGLVPAGATLSMRSYRQDRLTDGPWCDVRWKQTWGFLPCAMLDPAEHPPGR